MFKIIGADGKEYGPVSLDQLKQWITEGRLNAQSKVRPEEDPNWRTVAEVPELATVIPAQAAISPGAGPMNSADEASRLVNGPAIGLIVVASIAIALVLLNLVLMAAGIGGFQFPQNTEAPPEIIRMAQKLGGIIGVVIGLAIYGTILFGAIKMKKLQSYGLAMTAAILALLPCSLCCLAGLPIGIWAIVVLNKPAVKNSFT